MTDGYLSKDRAHLNEGQKARRARLVRIDYMPGKDALAAIDAKRATVRPGSGAAANSAILDSIVAEWAELSGIKYNEIQAPMSSGKSPGINRHLRARPYDFDSEQPIWAASWLAAGRAREATKRVICGARRHRDGQPCRAKSEPGKRRCRFHGGCSTGPRTPEGKARSLANLRRPKGYSSQDAQS